MSGFKAVTGVGVLPTITFTDDIGPGFPAGEYIVIPKGGEDDHLRVLMEAYDIHKQRSASYGDNWRESGWRGALFKLRLRCSRAWDVLWSADPAGHEATAYAPHDVDDLLDVVNFAVQTVILVREGDRDGSWRYDR